MIKNTNLPLKKANAATLDVNPDTIVVGDG